MPDTTHAPIQLTSITPANTHIWLSLLAGSRPGTCMTIMMTRELRVRMNVPCTDSNSEVILDLAPHKRLHTEGSLGRSQVPRRMLAACRRWSCASSCCPRVKCGEPKKLVTVSVYRPKSLNAVRQGSGSLLGQQPVFQTITTSSRAQAQIGGGLGGSGLSSKRTLVSSVSGVGQHIDSRPFSGNKGSTINVAGNGFDSRRSLSILSH